MDSSFLRNLVVAEVKCVGGPLAGVHAVKGSIRHGGSVIG